MPRIPDPDKGPAPGPRATAPKDTAERIAKVLARAGVASRRAAEVMIAEGRVAVNGRTLDSPALTVGPRDRITVDGVPLAAAEPPRLWLYHKPSGLVTTARDEKGRATVFDNLPEGLPRVMPVGRLDLNSEGLLLLTNDGELKRRLELPATGWLRRYRVRVHGTPTEGQIQPLKDGLVVDGERFQPMQVVLDRQQGANAWLTIGLREGKNREIRRAMDSVGLVVNRLIRIGYGPFQLGELAPGAVEEVRPRILRDQLGLAVTTPRTPRPPAPDASPQSVDKPVAGRGGKPDAGARPARGQGHGTGPAAARPGGKNDEPAPQARFKSWGSKSRGAPAVGDDTAPRPRSWGSRSAAHQVATARSGPGDQARAGSAPSAATKAGRPDRSDGQRTARPAKPRSGATPAKDPSPPRGPRPGKPRPRG